MVNVNIAPKDLKNVRKSLPSPVMVTGMHNSGTSVLARLVHDSGIFMDNSMPHFESRFFSEFINDRLIMGGGGNWAKLPIMSEDEVLSYKSTVGGFMKRNWIVEYLQNGYDGSSPWGFKDPRLCVLMPLYIRIFPEAKVLYIDRNTKDVAASLSRKKKYGVGKIEDIEHWIGLTNRYKDRIESFRNKISKFHYVKYEEMCKNTESVVKKILNFLGQKRNKKMENTMNSIHSDRIGTYDRYYKSRPIFKSLFEYFGFY